MTRRGFIIVPVLVIMGLSSMACTLSSWPVVHGSGRVAEKAFDVEGFSGVALGNQGDLSIELGEAESLVVEAEDNVIPQLEVYVSDGVLHLGTRPGVSLYPTRPIRFYLTVTELDTLRVSGSGNVEGPVMEGEHVSVTVSGSGDVRLDGLLAEDDVEVRVSGSGGVDVTGGGTDWLNLAAEQASVRISGSGGVDLGDVQAERIEVQLSGSGDLDVDGGEVAEQDVRISGSGVYSARDLATAMTDVHVTGTGSATVRVSDRLKARVSGSGDVRYIGAPRIEQTVTGSGDVRQIEG